MEPVYHPGRVERDAQAFWNETNAFRAVEDPGKRKYYCLSMFPYPSGKLHMGHVRNYTIGDVLTRYYRMRGCNVLQPMGWDAFGLPAENAAMANGVPPAQWTYENIAYMKQQLQSLGFAIDWERELATCKPDYYRWNQWLFLRMLEKGIAYKHTGVVNWDPVDQTVLANEQVIDGRGWRTGAVVEKREIPMYYLRITKYAEELLAALDKLPGWPERVKLMQANWIGRSEGVNFGFPYELEGEKKVMRVFTTRADTIMGVTFCAVAAEHPLAAVAARRDPTIAAFVDECKRGSVMEADLATIEKKGMPTGLFVTHPLTGAQVEVWVGNYVLMGYGEGAVMGVPAHDERDFAFAKKYGLPIRQVIEVADKTFSTNAWEPWYADYGKCVNSGKFDGLDYEQAIDAIAADLQAKGLGGKQVQWRLRDWGISRQRYWGTPVPIVHCAACGDVPVPDKDLPVVLPEDCVPDGSGNPLNKRTSFLDTPCPKCGEPARRETDTMDTFVDSSWYFSRFASPDASDAMVDARVNYWLPVDQYIGGIEHAILHLLYARFWSKVMRDLGLVKFDEPFANLLTQGMVLNHVFLRVDEKGKRTFYAPEELDIACDDAGRVTGATTKADGLAVEYGGISTMSKSSRNGVDPQELIDRYGADTARFFIIFTSPPEQTLEWNDAGVEGAARFLKRVWAFCAQWAPVLAETSQQREGAYTDHFFPRELAKLKPEMAKLRREVHTHLRQATYDVDRMQFNTVASATMKMLNALQQATATPLDTPDPMPGVFQQVLHEGVSILLRVLHPIAPHIAHVLWRELGFSGDPMSAAWPEADPAALETDEIELVLQVNGKLRGHLRVPKDADKATVERLGLAHEAVARFAEGRPPKKVVVVPGRLVNVVV
ncbi:MAG TPA: leucine--tRNA ligase [Burkholderiales bacterium]|nr:leucine--tRNA ligase [Burkholderiales bacterium]